MIPKLAANTAPTPESVREDLPHVVGFLSRLEAAHPGHVGDHLLAFLDAAQTNDLALAMLAAALGGTPKR